ncbi:peptidase M61 [Nitrospirillum iridis]|uniref:Putative metalloprotease with PDZ domain n=1 Tax=Nitrospirillum iridis TaxID=765888 RepID=A0A7X0AYB3_9PROT|nr:peptidase M61 [Nitrospirillum iridis]MBB6250839.1 putative metalloprotease with PDZ domain [Nitrospirillum iridis]
MRHLKTLGLAAMLALSAAPVALAAPVAAPELTVTLKPAASDADGTVPFVDVTVDIPAVSAGAGAPLLRLPLVADNVRTVAETLSNLSASDDAGPLDLVVQDDADKPTRAYRHWTAARAVRGTLTVRYRAPVTTLANPRGAAPPLELRTDGGGFSGAAETFLIVPEADTAYRLAIRWDLSASGGGAAGVSSLGTGDVTSPDALTPEELGATYVMGGAVHRYPEVPPRQGFFSVWQGSPPFDGTALMRWTETLYHHYLGYFKAEGTPPYGVFLRPNLVNAGGGVELNGSFIGTFDQKTDERQFKFTLAHEMVHTFIESLDSPQGLQSSWFSEGIAVYYQNRLPLRAGMITGDEFLKDLNTTAARYYTNVLNTTPNSVIPERFWADTRVRVLPYDRGALYFALVDGEVRKASHGRRSLDDLVLAMLDRRRHGQPMDHAAWVATVTKELGPRGKVELEAMLGGALVLPDDDAFGPCFTRVTAPLRRYQLGFDPEVLIEPKRIVHGLIPGSAAAVAGLRDGDEIVRPVPQDGIQADQKATLTLQVRRDGQVFPITYLPRGEMVDAYQWARRPGAPASCR